MKKINNVATSTRKQPFYGRMFDHQNDGLAEIAKSLALQIIGNYTANDVVILYGCVNSGASSGAGLAFNVSAGAVYYNGEIYQVAAFSGVFSGTNVIVGTINTTNYQAGEPSLCSDGSLQFVAQDNIFVLTQAASGSGTKDLSSFKRRAATNDNAFLKSSAPITPGFSLTTIISFTTPNDGATRDYDFELTAVIDANSGSSQLELNSEIFFATISKSTEKANINNLDRIVYSHIFSAQNVPANTLIEVKLSRTGGTDGTIDNWKFKRIGIPNI